MWHPIVFELPCLLRALYLQFLFTHVSLSSNDVVLRLPMLTSSVFMRINCNFVTTVGLTNDERCLIHNLRVEKHCQGSGTILQKMFSNKYAHLKRK